MGAPSRFLYGLLLAAERHPAPNALKVALGSAALIGLAALLIGIIMMTGSSDSFMQWALSPLTGAGIGK